MDMGKAMLLLLGVIANNFTGRIKSEVVPIVKAEIRNQFQQDNLPKEARFLILDMRESTARGIWKSPEQREKVGN